jgi:hypothetical protein
VALHDDLLLGWWNVGHHESARQEGWRASVLTPKGIGADPQIRWAQAAIATATVAALNRLMLRRFG